MLALTQIASVAKKATLFSVVIVSSCNVDGKSNRAGFDENLLIARDEKGRQINRHVYRIKDRITYETYSQGVCGVAGVKESEKGEFAIRNSIFNLTRAATRAKYYVDISKRKIPNMEWAGFFQYKACRERYGDQERDLTTFITVKTNKIDQFDSIFDAKILYDERHLVASYFKEREKICEIRLKFSGYYVVGSEIDFVSKGKMLPLLNEPDQLACIYRGVMASVGYFGYLNMPVSKLLDPKDSNYNRNPIMIEGDSMGPTGKTGFWPFLSTGLSIDTDRLRPPLGADDKQPGDVVGN